MRNKRNRSPRRSGSDGSLWLSFSDLMSALVLIIILILFYVMYQYFEMYETNVAELAKQEEQIELANAELVLQRTALDTTRTELEERESELQTAQEELDKRREELETSQNTLKTTQTTLSEAEETIKTTKAELAVLQENLDKKEEELERKETQIAEQQTELDNAQNALETQQAQIEQLIGIKPKIITELSSALRSANIPAGVDTATGAITLEADVLFSTNEYNLKPEGMTEIDKFLPVYLDVLFSDEYRPYLSQIIIEGHTDSRGSYITNLNLSQQRAASVAAYVLADNYAAITPEQRELLRKYTTANGRSYSDPVYRADGSEDLDASRRVVFKFQLIDEQMVAQMQTILMESLSGSADEVEE